jgi:phosphatidylglycerophosphatase A
LILSRKVDDSARAIFQKQHNRKLYKILLVKPWHWLTIGFGSGLMPWIPGTWGTLPGILLVLIATQFNLLIYVLIAIMTTVVGIGLSADLSAQLQQHDPSVVVWDEMVGMLWSMVAVPLTWYWMVAAFMIFRLLDSIKPWPISAIDQNITGGEGIMLDDVLAGVATLAIMHTLLIIVWYVA